jgi:ABC-type uncharacterized transport system involved in gliding motility auxiliary subunit
MLKHIKNMPLYTKILLVYFVLFAYHFLIGLLIQRASIDMYEHLLASLVTALNWTVAVLVIKCIK